MSRAEVVMYSSAICPYCVAAKNFLKQRGVEWREVRVDLDPVARTEMLERARRTSADTKKKNTRTTNTCSWKRQEMMAYSAWEN